MRAVISSRRTALLTALVWLGVQSASGIPAAHAGDAPPAPEFSLPARAGQEVSLQSLRGQVVMLNFWASWCGPCRTEMPLLEQMHRRYASLGFTLLGVNVEADTRAAENWLEDTPVSFQILFDRDSKVSKLYGVDAMPSTIFIDRQGRVRHLHRGYQPGDESDYLDQIRALLKE